MKKPVKIHSRAAARRRGEARFKGRHMGPGKRGGGAARMASKILWIYRLRILRRLLRKQRDTIKIDKHLYRNFYMKCKGNAFKNKRVLIEAIQKEKEEKARDKLILDQIEARRTRIKATRDKRANKREERSA